MKFNSIIIFVNNICSVGCATCNVSAKSSNKSVLDRKKLDILLKESKSAELSKYVTWTGGEPFLSFELLLYGLKKAEDLGFKSEVLTSGVWFDKDPEFIDKLKGIRDISIRISLDYEHNKKVSHKTLIKLIERSLDNKIDINFTVRKIPGVNYSPDDLFMRIKGGFSEYFLKKKSDFRWIHTIPHIPVHEDDPYISEIRDFHVSKKGCKFVYKDLVTGWDGFVYPCCGLFSVADFNGFALTEITGGFSNRIESLIKSDRLFFMIRSSGPSSLTDKVEIPDRIKWSIKSMNSCFVCNRILDNWNVNDKIV